MEKKGEILNQLAIICDLIEKTNLETKSKKVIFDMGKSEFDKMFKVLQQKYKYTITKPENGFTIKIGDVDIIFNMNNV